MYWRKNSKTCWMGKRACCFVNKVQNIFKCGIFLKKIAFYWQQQRVFLLCHTHMYLLYSAYTILPDCRSLHQNKVVAATAVFFLRQKFKFSNKCVFLFNDSKHVEYLSNNKLCRPGRISMWYVFIIYFLSLPVNSMFVVPSGCKVK